MAPDFKKMLDIFLEEKTYKEFFYEDNKSKDETKRWIKKVLLTKKSLTLFSDFSSSF